MTSFAMPFGTTAYQNLDHLLTGGQQYSQIREGDFTNHATLTAEALVYLGRPTAAQAAIGDGRDGWYPESTPLDPNPPALDATFRSRKGVLDRRGDATQLGSLNEYFQNRLLVGSYLEVARPYISMLADNVSADLFHGVIQVAHGLRALSVGDTPVRRRELARGLALWAARHERLSVPSGGESVGPKQAWTQLADIQTPTRNGLQATIREALKEPRVLSVLQSTLGFQDPPSTAAQVGAVMAAQFRRQQPDPKGPSGMQIVMLHAVTGAQAVHALVPLVEPATQRAMVRSLLASTITMTAAYAHTAVLPQPATYGRLAKDELANLAAAGREAHVSKAVAAALALSGGRLNAELVQFAVHAGLCMDTKGIQENAPNLYERAINPSRLSLA